MMFIVAVSGYDGCGKTTIAKRLESFLKSSGFKVVYRHEYNYMLLSYFFKIPSEKRVEKYRREFLKGRKSWFNSLWPLLVWIDLFLQYIYFKLLRGGIVIMDRYAFDHYLSFKYLGHLTWLTETLYKLFPKPDLHIMLWVYPTLAYQRKRQTHKYSLDYYRHLALEYLKLSERLNVPLVRSDSSVERTFRKTLKRIFENIRFLNFFIDNCRKNKILYSIISEKQLYECNKIFRIYYKMYSEKEVCYKKLLKSICKVNKSEKCIIVKDPKRSFKWVPETDIDFILIRNNDETKAVINKWKRIFKFDIVPFQHIQPVIESLKIDMSSQKILMPSRFLLGLIVLNGGLIRFDEYLTINEELKNERIFGDIGFIIIKEYIENIKMGDVSFPHFIPLKIFLISLVNISLPKTIKIRLFVFRIITEFYFNITKKLLFHSFSDR